jgi:hypothetical protein
MAPEQRFCEECGKPLTPGVKFCEECGTPVLSPGPAVQGVMEPVPPVPAGVPLAVIPFAYQQRGVFSTDRCNIVVYPDQVVIAYVSRALEKEYDQAMNEVEATIAEKHLSGKNFWQLAAGAGSALFRVAWNPVGYHAEDTLRDQKLLRNVTLRTRPWERYSSMAPGAVLAEDSRNKVLSRESISRIRGESDPETSTEQVLIYSSAGVTRIFFDYGIYFLARTVLFSFLFPGQEVTEKIIGVIPSGAESQVEGFGFQYTWILVVTDKRVLFCMVEDEMADEIGAWTEARQKEAKSAGRKFRDGELAGSPDAPWQQLIKDPIPTLLENDVNFFIPVPSILSARLVPGGPRKGDELSFDLRGGPCSIVFPDGTADYIRAVLGPVLKGRLS